MENTGDTENNLIRNSWQELSIVLNTTTVYRILATNRPKDCLAIYLFYCATAVRQGKQPIKATNNFVMKGLGMGKKVFQEASKILENLGIIEKITRRSEDGKITGRYIMVHYLRNEASESQVSQKHHMQQEANASRSKWETNTEDKKVNTEDKNVNTSSAENTDFNLEVESDEIDTSKVTDLDWKPRTHVEHQAKTYAEYFDEMDKFPMWLGIVNRYTNDELGRAYSFIVDHPEADKKGKARLFMWKLKDLRGQKEL